MQTAPALRSALEALAATLPRERLAAAAQRVSERYRAAEGSRAITNRDEAIAYAVYRSPATFAALSVVLQRAVSGDVRPPDTVLDLGAGTGIAAFALGPLFPHTSLRLLEQQDVMRQVGETLTKNDPSLAGRSTWQAGNISDRLDSADWVIASYVLGELAQKALNDALPRIWTATRDRLILVEPGTPRGYATLMQARQRLLDLGATILAPCPHQAPCPLQAPDWCHFSVRLPRLRAHMAAKGASVPFEDEPYSYLIAARSSPQIPAAARILRPPHRSKAGLAFHLCTPAGTTTTHDTPARDKDAFRAHRKLDWGDTLET